MNDKHQIFFNTALKLIAKKGFKATTMRDLAKVMDCDVSNLYNYIDSKQSFLETVLFDMNDLFQNQIDQIIESDYDAISQLKLVIRFYVELSIDRPLELSLLANEWRNLEGSKLTDFTIQRKLFESKVKNILEEGIKDKSISLIDSTLATHLFLSSLRLLFNNSDTKLSKIELERQINMYIFKGLNN